MRWKDKKVRPRKDETREVTRFLWFPKEINQETRWLEKATYKQIYWGEGLGWYDMWWINKQE